MKLITITLILMPSLIGLYFLPSFVALVRRAKSVTIIVFLNFVFGWTIIGWLIALAWSMKDEVKK